VAVNPIGNEEDIPPVWKVLIVDGDEGEHRRTKNELEGFCFLDRQVQIMDAYSPEEALKILRKNAQISVALIGGDSGTFENSELGLLESIRHELRFGELRIIIRSKTGDQLLHEEIAREYDVVGISDQGPSVFYRLRGELVSAFRSYANLLTINELQHNLEKKVRERTQALSEANLKLRSYISRLESDQAAGGRMQQKLFPESLKSYGDTTFSSRVYSSMYLSGDFLDYFEIDPQRVGFYMADVSGHGISSAFITVLLKNFIDTQLENYWNEGNHLVMKPLMLMHKLNSELLRENFGKYLTIFYGVLDQKENTLRYSNCGQFPPPLLRDGERTIPLSHSGTPVGMFQSPEFVEEVAEIGRQASLLVISDGILELLHNGSIREKRDMIAGIFEQGEMNLDRITDGLGMTKHFSFPDDVTFLLLNRSLA